MKIKQEFWELIKSSNKTIELRKVDKLKKLNYQQINIFDKQGRFSILLDTENKYLGKLTFNGYEIIKKKWLFNLLNQILDDVKDNIGGTEYYDLDEEIDYGLNDIQDNLDNNEKLPQWLFKNINWLIEVFEVEDKENNCYQDLRINKLIEDYFKGEEEILVLKIESWEE